MKIKKILIYSDDRDRTEYFHFISFKLTFLFVLAFRIDPSKMSHEYINIIWSLQSYRLVVH